MQLFYESSSEDGFCEGLNLFKGRFEKLEPTDANLKIPHMGWNALTATQEHPLIPTEFDAPHVYFVHSYALVDWDPAEVIMTTEYGVTIPAMVVKGAFAGMQFHPEKSAYVGKKILERVIDYFELKGGNA
jgi:glutamine amidotransferase